MNCWQFIDQERRTYSVDLLCRTLHVSPARYYAWRQQPRPAAALPATEDWQAALKAVFRQHKRCYGTRRLRAELQAQDHRVGRQRLRAAMRRHGLRCAPNRLLDQPKPTQANRVWVSGITFLPLASGVMGLPVCFSGCLHSPGGRLASA